MLVLDSECPSTAECCESLSLGTPESLPNARRPLVDWANASDDFLVYSRRQRDAELPVEYDV